MNSKLVLALGGAFLAACGAYIFGSGSEKKKTKDQVRGLENNGNTCFLNSLLQAWAACPSIYTWLHSSVETASRADGMLASSILKILQVLNNEVSEAPDPYNPGRILLELRARRWVITAEEQDAHELLHVLTETLDEETSRYPSVLSLLDVKHLEDPSSEYQPQQSACTRSQGLLPKLPQRHTDQPSRGLLASQLQCLSCGARCPVKYGVFDSISLSIPHNYWGPLSLDGMLRQFISSEVVQDVDCGNCAKLSTSKTVKSNFRKKVSFGKLPQVLCVHLQRTQWLDNGMPVKRQDHIAFPDTLHMDQYLYANQKQGGGDISGLKGGTDRTLSILSQSPKAPTASTSGPVNLLRTLNYDHQLTQTGLFVQHPHMSPQLPEEMSDINHNAPPEAFKSPSGLTYKLSSVINHLGDIESGHFVSYRRGIHAGLGASQGAGGLGKRWWLTSDTSVTRVHVDQVLASEAYMLFYERL